MQNKKALAIIGAQVEAFVIFSIILGAAIGFMIKPLTTSYLVIFLFGIMTGTLVFNHKRSKLPYLLVTCGFAIGYVIGNNTARDSLLGLAFLAANITAYQVLSYKLVKNI